MTTVRTTRRTPVRVWLPAFVRRDWRVARTYRLQFVLDLAAVPLALAVFLFVSRLVDTSELPADPDLAGGYFSFAAVGIAMFRMVQTAFTAVSLKLREEQISGTFEALVATPVSASALVLGSASFELVKATFGGLVTLVVAALFGVRFELGLGSLAGLALGLPALLACFAAVGVMVAACAVVVKQVTALLGVVTTGLALLAGIYFPITYLPGPLEAMADLLPFTWGVDVLRAALLRNELVGGRLGLLLGFAAVALPVSLRVFQATVDHARRQGSLTQF